MEASTSASRTSDEPSGGSRERDESRSGRMEDRDRDERSGRSRRDDDYDRRDGSRRRDDDRYDARRRHHDDRDRRSDNYDRDRNRDRDRDSSRRDHRQERRSSPGGRERDSGRDWERERERDYRRDAVRSRNGEDDRRQGGYGDTDRSRNRDADRERRRRDSRSPPPQDGRDGRNGATSRSNDEGAATGAHGLPPLVTEEPTSARVQQFVPPTRESILAERVRTGAPAAPKRAVRLIEVVANDRLGGKVRVKCSPKDTVGDLKKLIAVQKGTKPEKIVLKKWYTIYKDHVSLEDYEIHDGMSLEMS